MKTFQPHYRITVQKKGDCLAETGVDDVKILAARSEQADAEALAQAKAIADTLSVGEDGRCDPDFIEYNVFINYYAQAMKPELVRRPVVRAYAFDARADYTLV